MDDDHRHALLTAMYRQSTPPPDPPADLAPALADRHDLTDAMGPPVEVPSLALMQNLQQMLAQQAETIRRLSPAEDHAPQRLANLERRLADTENALRRLEQGMSHLRQQIARTGRHLGDMHHAVNSRRDPL